MFASADSKADLEHRFAYHAPPHQGIADLHGHLRGLMHHCAMHFDEELPDCREKQIAIKALEDAMMWANAAVARNHAQLEHTNPENQPEKTDAE